MSDDMELVASVDSIIETLRFNSQNMIAEETLSDAWAMLRMAREQWAVDTNTWIAFRELLRAHLSAAADAIERQAGEIERLREALEPFAAIWDENLLDYSGLLDHQGGFSPAGRQDETAWGLNRVEITWGDFRRARTSTQGGGEK